jgi:citrate lyase subunit beta/citryl-CoA lyase
MSRSRRSGWLVQAAHLTCPATQWKYVVGGCTASAADLVMLDLEDSIPRGDAAALELGRANVVRALVELDWGRRRRCFRPRGRTLDPELEDVAAILHGAGARVEGLVYPKVDEADEVRWLDQRLGALEHAAGLPGGAIALEVLIESVEAEENAFAIARASERLVGLIFGDFDYWSSLGLAAVEYRSDHPLVEEARRRVVKAAASVGIAAIAGMTLNYPTRDKTPEERHAALDECRRDAEHARDLGFAGKWTGIPVQTAIVAEVFQPSAASVARALDAVRRFREAERQGRGAILLDGKMADRATDRVHRTTLAHAWARGLVDDATALELGLER